MFHHAVYSESQGIGATNDPIAALSDQAITRLTTNSYIFKRDVKLLAAYAHGVGISRPRINTPSMRVPFLPSIQPVDLTANPGDLPAICDYRDQDLIIPAVDGVQVESTNTDAGAQIHKVHLFVSPDPIPASKGPVRTARFTFNITGVTDVWTLGDIVFEQGLPEGDYEVIGLSVIGANLVAARLVFPDNGQWRPGCIGRVTEGIDERFQFRMGRMGSWGTFASFAQPQMEILMSTGAGLNSQGYMDLIKVS